VKISLRDKEIEIPEREIWTYPKTGRPILSHTAMQRIARACGIYPLKSELLFKSEDWISLNVGITDGKESVWFIGEASHLNCPEKSPGRNYLACMAYKRGFDKGVQFLAELFDFGTEAEDFGNGEVPKYQKRDRKAPKPIAKPVVKPIPIEKLSGNGGAPKNNGNQLNPKILAKIEELSKELQIEARADFKDSGEATAYLNELLSKCREARVRGGE